jgi:hypothetical protein
MKIYLRCDILRFLPTKFFACSTVLIDVTLFLSSPPPPPPKNNFLNTGLVKIMLTLMDYSRKIRDISDLKDRILTVVSSIPSEMCVRALNGNVARWL